VAGSSSWMGGTNGCQGSAYSVSVHKASVAFALRLKQGGGRRSVRERARGGRECASAERVRPSVRRGCGWVGEGFGTAKVVHASLVQLGGARAMGLRGSPATVPSNGKPRERKREGEERAGSGLPGSGCESSAVISTGQMQL
jgi:hypothetical protein